MRKNESKKVDVNNSVAYSPPLSTSIGIPPPPLTIDVIYELFLFLCAVFSLFSSLLL